MQRRIPLALIALILITPILAHAAVPRTVSWQGIVEDGNGIPLQGNHVLTFFLHDDPSAGSILWEEGHAVVLVDGLAEVTLGSNQTLAGVDFDQALWLGVSVDGDTELTPRVELSAVPYALAIDDAAAVKSLNGLTGDMNLIAGNNVTLVPNGNDITINATGGGGADGDWNIVGSDLTLGVSGNVGVGQTNPTHKLDIATPINVPVSVKMRSGGSWSLVIEQSPESVFSITNGGSQRFAIDPGGRVGVGTTSPSALLHLDSPSRTNEMLIGRDSGTGTAPFEDLGVRLSTEKLEFTKWIDLGESGVGLIQAGIYSTGLGWELDGIGGTAGGFNIHGALTAEDAFILSSSADASIQLKNGNTLKWTVANDISAGDAFSIRASSNSLPALRIDHSDRKSIFGGNVEPSASALWALGSSGKRWSTIYAMAVDTPSDRRLKKNIDDLDYGLEEVMDLRPVRYEWKQNPELGEQLGLIAQELREVLPELVNEADDEQKSLSVEYTSLIPVLIAAIQDQQAQIEAQNEEIARQGRALVELGLQVAGRGDGAKLSASAAQATGSTH